MEKNSLGTRLKQKAKTGVKLERCDGKNGKGFRLFKILRGFCLGKFLYFIFHLYK